MNLLPMAKGTGSLWVSPLPPSLGCPPALGLSAFTFSSSATERPCRHKLKHRSGTKLCLSRVFSASLPATAWPHKPLSAFLLGPASAPSILTMAWHLFGAPSMRLRLSCSAPVGLVHWQPCKPCPRQLPPCSEGDPALSLHISGAGPIPGLLLPPPQRPGPGEAGTPCPSEGCGPRCIQSRTAALRCLNWRCGCWQCLRALLQCLAWASGACLGLGGLHARPLPASPVPWAPSSRVLTKEGGI